MDCVDLHLPMAARSRDLSYMLGTAHSGILGKIAGDLDRAILERRTTGAPGRATGRRLAAGAGWSVSDVVCTSGPRDRAFEEEHDGASVAIVLAGTFEYRSAHGRHLMTPGSFLLGNPGECFECRHDHAVGDRCVSFKFDGDLFSQLTEEHEGFQSSRLPPERVSAALVARTALALAPASGAAWEEIALDVLTTAARLGSALRRGASDTSQRVIGRVTESVRLIERNPAGATALSELASAAGMSRFQFLRVFRSLTGVTPHQFILRTRLRAAAARIADSNAHIIDVALDAGFGDLSNFNHAFRAEFGVTPRVFRGRQSSANLRATK
jgi:AraC family transcriptional regulator